mgnify:CR=1 FL=1
MKDTIKHTYLAADFGGGSGRIIAGFLHHGKLELEEVYRFCNRQVKLGNHIYWDFPALFEDMKTGLKLAAQKRICRKKVLVLTPGGVDFGLIDKHGEPVRKSCLLPGMQERRECRQKYSSVWMNVDIMPKPVFR